MGCVGSREARRERRRNPTSIPKSLSLPAAGDSPRKEEKSFEIADLCFSSGGSCRFDGNLELSSDEETTKTKIPSRTRSYNLEPEIINAWELMEGLEDITPLRPSSASNSYPASRRRSLDHLPVRLKSPNMSPIWMQSAAEDHTEFDIDVIAKFQRAMKELSPETTPSEEPETPTFAGIVKARVTAFQEKIDAKKANFTAKASSLKADKCPPGGRGKLVMYFTSLRVVRKTFEDCWNARIIIQGYGFRIDERDVSIHGGFRDELREILGAGDVGVELPRVFADGKLLGGAEEVARMHEAGELEKALKDCDVVPLPEGRSSLACEGCGDVRFMLCERCSGSCKVFEGLEEEEEEEEENGGFRRCPECNENGLVRCTYCCY
ncbi:hypothetical protein KSP39_PZI016582 [Platanthera zijinensis]|uniref:Glutaredoxin domain-containing protein n=1 Tax=Platanthera zijinensis TaxID=2320716 RepID=A0AAP0B895_9ASPA